MNSDPPQPAGIRRVFGLLSVDRAVVYAVGVRVWQLLGGAVTVVLIGLFFRPDVQGYYYTFASLMALQSFFEMGLTIVVTNTSGHEWARLRIGADGKIDGDAAARSRLISLGRLVFCCYAAAALLYAIVVGFGGAWFLESSASNGVAWRWPWIALIVLNGLWLWSTPFVAMLEGCNQMAEVNRFRLIQAMTSNACVWSVIALRGELWAAVAATAARLLVDLYLLGVRYGRFFRPFFRSPEGERISWREEVWPMQWRLALGGAAGFFAYYLFTLVLFRHHSPALAGRMGMTWSLLATVQLSGLAWVQTRVPIFARLIVEKRYDELDRLFRKLTALSLGVMIAGGGAICVLIWGLNAAGHPFANRLLPLAPTAVFVAAVVLHQVPHCQAYYLRAHKQEPLLFAVLVSGGLIGVSVWFLGREFGPMGSAIGYLAVIALFQLPYQTWLWRRCRRLWHG